MAKKKFSLFTAARRHSDALTGWAIFFLCLVSLLCAACNVVLPVLEKNVLQQLDATSDESLWILFAVGVSGAILLGIESFINIAIMQRFRRELEREMEASLVRKEQPMIVEKGVGVFSATIVGDAEQLSRVLAASWFSIAFNLVGAVISIVISARWKLYFLVIVLIAYTLILAVIFICNRISVHYFRQEKVVSYQISAKVREMVETQRSIMGYGSFLDFQRGLEPELRLRSKCVKRSERALGISNALIKLIQTVAIIAFFFCAVYELRGVSDPAARNELYPTFIALVSYFETIFVPIAALNTSFNNASKFRAFYEPYSGLVEEVGLGELPSSLSIDFHGVGLIREGQIILSDVSFPLDQIYGVVGLEGESRAAFLSYVRGESYPPDGHIAMGGARIYEIEKNLRYSLLSFNPMSAEVFGGGLEFNLTLGKTLLVDEEYEERLGQFQADLRAFFASCHEDTLFANRQSKERTKRILGAMFALSPRDYRGKDIQEEIKGMFCRVADEEAFIQSVGVSVFAKMYAKESRYRHLIDSLDLYSLKERDFGVAGKRLTDTERCLVRLARFLLPDTQNPFVLVDPLEHLPPESANRVLSTMKKLLKGRRGLIITPDLEAMRYLSESIIVFDNGHIHAIGKHTALLRNNGTYQNIWEAGLKHTAKPKKK